MKFLPLVWRNLLRRKFRTIFTLATVFISFVLYAFLMTVRTAFSMGVEVAGVDRLMMMHKVSLVQLLPISYLQQIQTTPNVKLASYSTWFGGTYQDTANQFAVMAVDPERYLDLYPEFKVPPAQAAAWKADRQGALVGIDIADAVRLEDRRQGARFRRPSGSRRTGNTWYFNIDAHLRRRQDDRQDQLLLPLRLSRREPPRRVRHGRLVHHQDRRSVAGRGRRPPALDAQFANSSAETKTSTEKAFLQGFVNQVGNISLMIESILVAVLFTLFLLVLANTMAQAVRERTNEFAVLKTLGFSNGLVLCPGPRRVAVPSR